MGFDNECILNIQSLAGEYFCPVCRLLVYPNEAVQSQCTHLYCKPCLTYVVGTTRACPYDGYLVTEADSKPLTESNKALAETIGKIAVHCLYHRSGCTWQGPLSDCTSHCTGCAFGNSPVVCNRCAVQIVHSQVQEHAQNCSGVQSQSQQTDAGQETAHAGNQNKSGNQVGPPTTAQAQTSQTAASTTPAGQDPNAYAQAVHGAGLTPEQLYQQQQQYQQYYQQYPGYDPYQQQYQQPLYPYQQHAAQQYQQQPAHAPGQHTAAYVLPHPLPQAQAQPQPITQPQPQGQPQLQVNPPQQPHPAVHPHSQIPPQSHPQAPGNPPPQPQLYPQPQPQPQYYPGQNPPQAYPLPQQVLQMPQYQSLQSQMQSPQPQIQPHQPTPHSVAQPQPQPHPHPQHQLHTSQSNQPPHVSGHQSYQQPQPQQHSMSMHPHSVPNQVPQHPPIQIQSQFHQQPAQMRPPIPSQQLPIIHPAQQVHPHAHQPGHPIPSRPAIHPNQQPMPQQHVQQQHFPFSGQPIAPVQNQLHEQGIVFHHHQQPVQSQLHPHVPSSANPQIHPTAAFSHGTLPFQSQNYVGRPLFPNHVGQSQPFAVQSGAHKQSMPQNNLTRTTNQSQTMSEQQLSNSQIGLDNVMTEGGGEVKLSAGIPMKSDANYAKTSGSADDSVESKTVIPVILEDANVTSQAGPGINSELNALEKNDHVVKRMVKEEAIEGSLEPSAAGKSLGNVGEYQKDQEQGDQHSFKENEGQGEATTLEGGRELRTDPLDNSRNVLPTFGEDKNTKGFPVNKLPQGQVPQVSGQTSYPDQPAHYEHYAPSMLHARPPGPPHGQVPHNQLMPQGSGYMGQGKPINHPDHMQPFGRGPSGGSLLPPPPPPFDVHGGTMTKAPPHTEEMFMSQRHGYLDGRQPDLQHSGPPTGIRDDRFKPPYPMDPSRHMIDRGEFEDDLKQFPRPSHLDADPKFGGYFSSSRPIDKPPHGSHYEAGLKLDPRNISHPHDAGDRLRPASFHGDNMGRSEFLRGRPDFFGPAPQYGRFHMDGSPIRDYPGMPPRRFNVHSDPMGPSHESRFPPPHFRRGEHEGPHNIRISDMIGQDIMPNHLRRDDPLGIPSHLRLGELPVPGNFPPRFGEPGFRSSYTHQDTGFFKGTMESYDNPRKRKTPSMGWCRICKVDSETMEGLDLHSQTREHQDTAMAMVLKIKQQNAKKKKLISNDHSAAEDASKPKTAGIENRRDRH